MNILARLRQLVTRTPKLVAPWLGVTLDALSWSADMPLRLPDESKVPLLTRTHNDGDSDSAMRILSLLGAGHQVLSVIPFGRGYGPIGLGMALQLDDAPDAQSPAVSPEHYGETFRLTMAALRTTLPASIPIVTAGFSINASVEWMQCALMAGAGDADAVCFHVGRPYDLLTSYQGRLTAVTKALARAGSGVKPLWITDVDLTTATPTSLDELLRESSLSLIARVYLSAPSASMLDVITAAQQRRRR